MLAKKISDGNSFHGKPIIDGYVHIPVVMQTASAFFDMMQSVNGTFITGHFIKTEADGEVEHDPFEYDFILIANEILNGKNTTHDLAAFNIYILNAVYYKRIILPPEFEIQFIINIEKNSQNTIGTTVQSKQGLLHSAVIPGVLR